VAARGEEEKVAMMKNGRPFEPGNQFGRGRPRGSRNKRSLVAQQLLDSHADPVMRKALVQAMKGDSRLLRMLLGYILGPQRDAPLKTGPLPVHTAVELAQTSESVFQRLASGKLTVPEARELSALIESRRKVIETRDLEERIRVLEKSVVTPN
jgi:hypothetical protein